MKLRLWTSFLKDRSGNLGVFSIITITPTLAIIALSFDYALLSLKKQIASYNLELAKEAGEAYILNNKNVQNLNKKQYIESFLKKNLANSLILEKDINLDITLPASGQKNLTLMALLSSNSFLPGRSPYLMKISSGIKEIEKIPPKTSVEIVFVLDAAFYQHDNEQEIRNKDHLANFKNELPSFLEKLKKKIEERYYPTSNVLKVAYVPFARFVNVGNQVYYGEKKKPSWLDTEGLSEIHFENIDKTKLDDLVIQNYKISKYDFTKDENGKEKKFSRFSLYDVLAHNKVSYNWNGCVEARPYPYDVYDDLPDPKVPETLFVPTFMPDTFNFEFKPQDEINYIPDYKGARRSESYVSYRMDIRKYFIAPATKNLNNYSDEGFGPNLGCPRSMGSIIPLYDAIKNPQLKINIKKSNISSRNLAEGFAWGWRVLSDTEPFTQGYSYKKDGNQKIIIMITGGGNLYYHTPNFDGDPENLKSEYGAYGFWDSIYRGKINRRKIRRIFLGTTRNVNYYSSFDARYAMNSYTKTVCENIKEKGIKIYSILFDYKFFNGNPKNPLKFCSSQEGGEFFKMVDNKQMFSEAMNEIRLEIEKYLFP